MPPFTAPFGPDSVAVPAYLVSDETDPAYRAWLAAHPEAFTAGTWTRTSPEQQAVPPDAGQSPSNNVERATTTGNVTARGDASASVAPIPAQRDGNGDRDR